jgi:hypothetical protein
MVDLDKVKAFWRDKMFSSAAMTHEDGFNALNHIEALVAEVERMREAAKAVIDDFDRADTQRYDECKWGEFGGVGPLEDALGLNGKGSSPAIIVPGNKPAVEVREDDGDFGHEDDQTMRCGHKGRSWSSVWKVCMECMEAGLPAPGAKVGIAEAMERTNEKFWPALERLADDGEVR